MKQQRFDIVYSYKLVKRVTLGAVDMHSRCNRRRAVTYENLLSLLGIDSRFLFKAVFRSVFASIPRTL